MTAGKSPRVVVGGAVAQRPDHGGHAWVFAHLLMGLRRLGCAVTFLDRIDGTGAVTERERAWIESFAAWLGLERDWSALLADGSTAGLPRNQVSRRIAQADLFLDVMGYVGSDTFPDCGGTRAFLDIDPGWPQMWRDLGLADVLEGYDAYVTVGENVGTSDCAIPTCGLPWLPTKQPVVLDLWPVSGETGDRFTTVASWRGPFGPIEYEGVVYGLRVHEFRTFFPLPHRVAAPFELALDIDQAETPDIEALDAHGWRRVDPLVAAGTPQRYRRYIQGSLAELMVAKQLYVATRSGWFSDRSACYLASGKPVLAQDTGLGRLLPTGEGLLTFTTLEEAVVGAEEILANPARHAKAARAVAEEHFDSDKVLRRLLAELGTT